MSMSDESAECPRQEASGYEGAQVQVSETGGGEGLDEGALRQRRLEGLLARIVMSKRAADWRELKEREDSGGE